jgi:hypothetical protein
MKEKDWENMLYMLGTCWEIWSYKIAKPELQDAIIASIIAATGSELTDDLVAFVAVVVELAPGSTLDVIVE